MLSRELPPPSRNPLLETNPISSPSNKFKSFSKDIDRDLSQEYIRRQLYAYGILHTQSNSVSGSAGNLAGSALSKRAGGQRGEGALEIDSELLAWKQFRTTQVVYKEVEGKLVPSLRAPFSSNTSHKNEIDHSSSPRWPREVESIECPVKFLTFSHPHPIEIHPPDVPQDIPPVPPDSEVHCVYRYNNCSGKEKCFTKSRIGPSHSHAEIPSRVYTFAENSLIFEARFESGNLRKANQVGEFEYDLYLQHDLYTGKYAQWFFFQVRNMQPGAKYRFVIMNLIKPASLYSEGMRPLFYSEKRAASSSKIGWLPHGENVFYYKNHLKYRLSDKSNKERSNYSLSWSCEFPHAEDTCYFSHSYPYTYSDLQAFLGRLHRFPLRSKICRQKLLCTSLAGNMVHLLTITNPSSSPAEMRAKRAIVISARVHPGETNSSYMMKGVIEFLTDPESADAHMLRNIFVFKIVPMLNPDGVITGNYRCSLSGCDLNRQYNKFSCMKEYFPVIFHLRQMMRKLCQEREVTVYCDLHGHSRKQNIFMYGCDDRARQQSPVGSAESGPGAGAGAGAGSHLRHVQSRILPFMLSKNAPHLFSYRYSRFKVQKYKEGCGRIAIWKEFNVMNSFTMEASFCGSNLGKLASSFFRTCDLEEMGHKLCDTFLDYFDPDPYKRERTLDEIYNILRQQVIQTLFKQGKPTPSMDKDPLDNLDLLEELSLDSESDGGSDSSVSDGTPAQCVAQNKARRLKKKRKSKRSRNKNKERKKRVRSRAGQLNVITASVCKANDTQPLSLSTRPPAGTRGKEGLPELLARCTKEYSSYGSGLNEQGRASPPTVRFKNRNGGIPVFSRERVEERQARKTRELSSPQSGGHFSMPDIPRGDWEGSPESFTHEFLKNISILSREPQEAPAERFTSVPNRLNLGKLEVYTPVSKVREEGYQSDCESDISQIRNLTPLLISKVPTVMHTGFSNSFLTQYVSTAAKESGTRLVEAAGSQHNSTVEASQALWPTSKGIGPQNPKSVVFTSFVSEQRFSDKLDAPHPPDSCPDTHAPTSSNHKSKVPHNPVRKSAESSSKTSASLRSEPQRDLRKLEDIRRDIDSLFLSKHKPAPQAKPHASPDKLLASTSPKVPSLARPPSPAPPLLSPPNKVQVLSSHPVPEALDVSLPIPALLKDFYRSTLSAEQDSEIKKLSLEIPREHSHSLLPLSKQTPTHPCLPSPSSSAILTKEKSPITSRVSIGNILPFSAAPQDGSFSTGHPKHPSVSVSLREQRISNAVHNIAELPPDSSVTQALIVPQRSRTRMDTKTAAISRLNSINMSEHCPQIDRVKSQLSGDTDAGLSSPVPAHISKLMQSGGRNTSVGGASCSLVLEQAGTCRLEEKSESLRHPPTKQLFVSISTDQGKPSVIFPNNSSTFSKTVVHSHPPPSPRRTPSPTKKTRPS